MATRRIPDIASVIECLKYNRRTGTFQWRKRPLKYFPNIRICNIWNTRYSGKIAGANQRGYITIAFNGYSVYAHRLAWLVVHGKPIPKQLDHINGDRADNRIKNLRPATNAQNQANARKPKNNTTGVKGVNMVRKGKFRAEIGFQYRNINLGHFDTLEEAIAARREAANRLHGKFARHE